MGILLSLLSLLFGFGQGGTFGLFEENIKGHLKVEAGAVLDSAYEGDAAAMKRVTDKAWASFKRAHLHAGATGSAALVLSLMMCFLGGTNGRVGGLVSAALGAGALGYPIFRMLAALRAPGMGGTGAAKESLLWVAAPSAGVMIVGMIASLVLVVREGYALRAWSGEAVGVDPHGFVPAIKVRVLVGCRNILSSTVLHE